MSEGDTKHYSIEIDCPDEETAKGVGQFMQTLARDGLLWFAGHTAANRWYAHTSPVGLDEALTIYRQADMRYPRVSLQSYVIDEIDASNWWTE